ncbi:MAG TPA: CBS domain-containing protein [Longimicrobiales bacterium]|nr:CBS domain-containing protein [Longimicrobiales bacterium]
MRVADLMRTDVYSVPADAPVRDAVTMMADAHVSGLPVVDGAGKVIGVITATDVLQAEAELEGGRAREQLFTDTAVRELMSSPPHLLAPDDDVRAAAQSMLYAEVRRLFVAEEGELVGVISQTDIVDALANGRL